MNERDGPRIPHEIHFRSFLRLCIGGRLTHHWCLLHVMGTDSHEAKNRKYFGSKSAVCLASGVSTSFTPLSGTKGVDFAGVGGIVNGHNVINVNVLALNEFVPVLVLSKKWALVRDVVEAVCFALGVHEHWYFGLTLSTHGKTNPISILSSIGTSSL